MNLVGLSAAAAAFFGVWFGHIAVRKIEFVSPTLWLPMMFFAAIGLGLEVQSLRTASAPISAFLGIVGVTLIWDAVEFIRQQGRIRKGHAPANPANRRHVRILAACSASTTLDLLKRDPVGRLVRSDEAQKLLEHKPSV